MKILFIKIFLIFGVSQPNTLYVNEKVSFFKTGMILIFEKKAHIFFSVQKKCKILSRLSVFGCSSVKIQRFMMTIDKKIKCTFKNIPLRVGKSTGYQFFHRDRINRYSFNGVRTVAALLLKRG